jgi:hypothetical protein
MYRVCLRMLTLPWWKKDRVPTEAKQRSNLSLARLRVATALLVCGSLVLRLDVGQFLPRQLRQFVRAFQPLDTGQPYAPDQFGAVRDKVAGQVVVTGRALRMAVVRVEP